MFRNFLSIPRSILPSRGTLSLISRQGSRHEFGDFEVRNIVHAALDETTLRSSQAWKKVVADGITYLVISAIAASPRALMSIIAVSPTTLHALAARNSSGDIAQRVPHLGVKIIVVVFAVVDMARGSQVVFVTKLAILDAGFESLLLLCCWCTKTSIDTLACSVYWYTFRVPGWCVLRCGSCDFGGGSFVGRFRSWGDILFVF